jgi:predicted nucleic acid-binding protein
VNPASVDAVVSDTDVLSFPFNRDPIRAPRYESLLGGTFIYISFASAAEMWFGALLRGWGERRISELERFLSQYTVIETVPEIRRAWARIRVDAQRSGFVIERQDAWIAATAIHLGVPLVTHNASHYAHMPHLDVFTSVDVKNDGSGSGS